MIYRNSREFKESFIWDNGYAYCELCRRSDRPPYDCDHIIPRSREFNKEKLWHKDNLIFICRICHTNKNLLKKEYDKLKKDRGLN